MSCWGRKALWALGFLLLLGTSSAQDTWEALLPSRLVEKSRVSAGMWEEGWGPRWVGGDPRGKGPQMLWFLSRVGVFNLSCSRSWAEGTQCPPEDTLLPAVRKRHVCPTGRLGFLKLN